MLWHAGRQEKPSHTARRLVWPSTKGRVREDWESGQRSVAPRFGEGEVKFIVNEGRRCVGINRGV